MAAHPAEGILGAKKALRERILAQRDALDAGLRREHSRAITATILALPEFAGARAIAAYCSFGSEYDTAALLEAVRATGKTLLLPRVDKAAGRIKLKRVQDPGADLVAGVWGIREPSTTCPTANAEEADFVLVPGVAFTRKGDRLGYGGGYYDRLLPMLRPDASRIAAAFSLQVVDSIPAAPHDQRVHRIVTESGIADAGA
jgi:5-formyltetrahydrofolate cyclo-ligase